MSKIQSSLQRAIQKSKGTAEPKRPSRRRGGKQAASDTVASGIFKVFRPTSPDLETMEDSRIVGAVDDRTAMTAYKMLRTRVLQRMRANNWHSILVTSPGPGEGKTLTSSNLAMSLSRDVNQAVMLVDLDLQRSTVAKYLGIGFDVNAGTGDFLQGKASIDDIVYSPTSLERIAILPNREAVEHSSELLASPRAQELVDWLGNQPERTIVIYDMPPVLACDDVLAFSPNVDAVLLVAAQGQTERSALEQTMGLLSESNILGVVLNKSSESAETDPYGYY